MNEIFDFRLNRNSGQVEWSFNGSTVKKQFYGRIQGMVLRSNQRILVLENKSNRNNVTIFDKIGNKVSCVKNPIEEAICFGDAYYIDKELTLFARTKGADMIACVVDEDGTILRTYEAR